MKRRRAQAHNKIGKRRILRRARRFRQRNVLAMFNYIHLKKRSGTERYRLRQKAQKLIQRLTKSTSDTEEKGSLVVEYITHYVFYSADVIKLGMFRNELVTWLNPMSMMLGKGILSDNIWLGNILLKAGFSKEDVEAGKYGYCSGVLSRSQSFKIDAENTEDGPIFYLRIDTRTVNRTTPVMWMNILKALYPQDDSIKFAYWAESNEDDICEKYDPENKLDLISFNTEAGFFINGNTPCLSEFSWLDYYGEATAKYMAEILTRILEVSVRPEDLSSDATFKGLVNEAREILKEKDSSVYFYASRIRVVDIKSNDYKE